MTKRPRHNLDPFPRALSILALAGCAVCLLLAIWYALRLFNPNLPYAKLSLHHFFIDLAGALGFYLLHRLIRNRN